MHGRPFLLELPAAQCVGAAPAPGDVFGFDLAPGVGSPLGGHGRAPALVLAFLQFVGLVGSGLVAGVGHHFPPELALSLVQGVSSSPSRGLDTGTVLDGLREAPFNTFRAVLEKSKTVRVERRGALEASTTARMLSGVADGPFTIEAGNRTVPLRSRPSAPTVPRVQCRPWPEPSGEQSGVRLVQDNGWPAVRRRPTWRATPPWARTRTVNDNV